MTRFTVGELEVMQVLWAHGKLKPAEIQERFPREIKNPALRSVLAILVEKGHISRKQVGKAFFYQAKAKRESVFKAKVRELADQFCDGSMRSLLFNLAESEKLSDEDVEHLKKLAKSNQSKPKKRGVK